MLPGRHQSVSAAQPKQRLRNYRQMMFTSPGKMVEQAVTMTRELLAEPEVIGVLGEEALRLSAQLDEAFVPNDRFGRLSVPKEYVNTDSAAILAVKPRRRLRLGYGFDRFTPGQFAAAEAFVALHEDGPSLPEIEEELAKSKDQKWAFVTADPADVRGWESSPPEYWPSASNINIEFDVGEQEISAGASQGAIEPKIIGLGRPVILLPYGIPGRIPASKRPEVIVHEAIHARQAIEKPLLWIDPSYGEVPSRGIRGVRKELEAYHPDAKVTQLLVDRGRYNHHEPELRSAGHALRVERLRGQHAPVDDPFYPTKAILDFFGVYLPDGITEPLREG